MLKIQLKLAGPAGAPDHPFQNGQAQLLHLSRLGLRRIPNQGLTGFGVAGKTLLVVCLCC